MQSVVAALEQTQSLVMVVGLMILLLLESARPFFDFFRGAPRERGRHALRNLLVGGLNAGLIVLVFVGLWLTAAVWAEQYRFGLLNQLHLAVALPMWAHAVGALLLLDAWTYLWHRLNHLIPFLWRFHRVHHADTQMDVTTASRFHLGEIFFSSLLRIPLILLLGLHFWELLIYETVMFAVVQVHHANLVLPEPLDRALRVIIVTPAMHKVHHSRFKPETDSNYSSLFSFWDRIGRSFRLRKDLSTLHFGLDEFDAEEHQTVLGMLRTPFSKPDQAP